MPENRLNSFNSNKIFKSSFSCVRDNLTIRGNIFKSEGEKLPIAIISHPFMANYMLVQHYAKILAKMGYASVCFDFCGGSAAFGKSEGKTTEMSVFTQTKDLKAVIKYARSLSYTDENEIVLMGCSQGGFVSALTAAELREEIKKLVLFYPALCIPDDARKGKMMFAKFDPENIPEIIKCGPMKLGRSYVTDVIGMDPFNEIIEYPGDVLIVHGTKDSVVSLNYVKNALKTYESRECGSCQLEIIKDAGHIFSPRYDKTAIEHLKDFLKIV